MINTETAWAAFLRRDRSQDGCYVGAVKSTGIYCKPSCPARHPKREYVTFFADGAQARAAGYRACLRCHPDEVGRDRAAVAKALALMADGEEGLALAQLAAAVGYAPHHFHRLFKRDTGVTPAAYARGLRAKRAESALARNASVTDAIYDAGYSGPSRFYAETKGRLGMTPSAWKNGGAGVVIRWAVAETSLGKMLVAATAKGLCRLSFNEDGDEIRRRFPQADVQPCGEDLRALVDGAVAAVENPRAMPDLPLDIAGTVFQQAVWRELMRIPPGETRTYTQLAMVAGNPRAVRAAGTACGQNQVAVLIPCHRAKRSDGGLGGYAYGLAIKEALLERERG
ncbi:MAG: hypothetical protein RL367_917 [Pseudomonadota bacterium]